MKIEILIALVAALASIIVAVISLISNRQNTKAMMKTNKELETLKLHLEVKRFKYALSDDALKSKIISLGNHIKNIQVLKDYLIYLKTTQVALLDTKNALAGMRERTKKMVDCYQDGSIHLDDKEVDIAHEAKRLIQDCEFYFTKTIQEQKFVELQESDFTHFDEIRARLTDFQNILRDKRMSILTEINEM